MISGLVFEGEGIGTHWWVRVNPDPSAVEAQRLGALIRATIDQFDAYYSRFKPDSLVSRLNATGEINNISAELIAMLAESERLRVVSDGQFNVGVGAQLEQLGYDAEYSFRAGERAAGLTGSVVTVHGSSARLAAGARIDLGGVGKGWLIDSIGRVL